VSFIDESITTAIAFEISLKFMVAVADIINETINKRPSGIIVAALSMIIIDDSNYI
jgi:hypothetical protein